MRKRKNQDENRRRAENNRRRENFNKSAPPYKGEFMDNGSYSVYSFARKAAPMMPASFPSSAVQMSVCLSLCLV